jgi:uncharacterized membrane protein
MPIVRQLIPGLSALMGVWVFLSFAGVMFNAGNAGFWTTSLISALLASVVLMPILVVLHHATAQGDRTAREAPAAFTSETPDPVGPTPRSPAASPARPEPADGE